MLFLRPLLLAGLSVALLALTAADADAAKKKGKKKKGEHAHHGVVENVSKTTEGHSITIKTHQHKKKKKAVAAGAAEEKRETFEINKNTEIFKVSGKKKNRERKPADLDDLKKHEHEHVIVFAEGKVAKKIEIVHHKKKKKAKKKAA